MGLKGAIELYLFTINMQFFFCKEASSMFVQQ